MNRWSIPAELEAQVRARDTECIYCRVSFHMATEQRGRRPSWEHIVNDASIVNQANIALCCISCNASKGAKTLQSWLTSKYCQRRRISEESIAPVARAALHTPGASA